LGSTEGKIKKKEAKAKIKALKAEAKLKKKIAKKAPEDLEKSTGEEIERLKEGVSVTIEKQQSRANLVIKGLTDEQLQKILPEVKKEVVITLTKEISPLKASLMRFIREGAMETLIKVVAGLIVGYLLIQFGLK
jgi:Na+(H+)/acetate symporter ActP